MLWAENVSLLTAQHIEKRICKKTTKKRVSSGKANEEDRVHEWASDRNLILVCSVCVCVCVVFSLFLFHLRELNGTRNKGKRSITSSKLMGNMSSVFSTNILLLDKYVFIVLYSACVWANYWESITYVINSCSLISNKPIYFALFINNTVVSKIASESFVFYVLFIY